jgi:hypothetical protein
VLEEEGGQSSLEQRGEHIPVAREPVELVRRDDRRPLLDQPRPQVELPGDDGAAGARDDVRTNLRQPPLGQVGEPLVERTGDGELEDAVAEELEPFVGVAPVAGPRRVCEGVVETLLRELFDQGCEPGDVARGCAAATGAT